MEIYLDANATTAVLPRARDAAVAAMAENFGNPSSLHSCGLRARATLDQARTIARQALNAPSGQLLFTSGATEGIQTSVLSALTEIRRRKEAGESSPFQILYGATEHKAVPEAIRHWNEVLGLHLTVREIPVGRDGLHDLSWLREEVATAGLVCTMAANNETGIVSNLEGIANVLRGTTALWLVDSVQALGKLTLKLVEHRIDYAPFSGHKLYAPKGIGMLYVRDGAPLTPLLTGGGQESALRSGTENMAGIAALGAVLLAMQDGTTFQDQTTLAVHRQRLEAALQDAFPGVVMNAPAHLSLATTINFSVPGLSSKLLLDLFDAAGIRVSGGSACSAAKGATSYVLEAMGLPEWRTASAIRLSFGPADSTELIDRACTRIRACGSSLRTSGLSSQPGDESLPVQLLTRFVANGSCCYLVADAASRRCVVIDPLPELTDRLARLVRRHGLTLAAILDTHSHGDHASSASELRSVVDAEFLDGSSFDGLGWPQGASSIQLGAVRLSRMPIPGHTKDSTAYLLYEGGDLRLAFVGDTVMPGALGRSDFLQSDPLSYAPSLRSLYEAVGPETLLLPGHDYEDRFATTLSIEGGVQPLLAGVIRGELDAVAFADAKSLLERDIPQTAYSTMACGARVDRCTRSIKVEVSAAEFKAMLHDHPDAILVDVRETYENVLGTPLHVDGGVIPVSVPMSNVLNAIPDWLQLCSSTPLFFFCRSGNRSSQIAHALRRLGHECSWSLEGGLALWSDENSCFQASA